LARQTGGVLPQQELKAKPAVKYEEKTDAKRGKAKKGDRNGRGAKNGRVRPSKKKKRICGSAPKVFEEPAREKNIKRKMKNFGASRGEN